MTDKGTREEVGRETTTDAHRVFRHYGAQIRRRNPKGADRHNGLTLMSRKAVCMAPLLRTGPCSAVAAFAASAVAFGGSVALLGPGVSSASSHREAPQILMDPLADNTDVFAYVSPDKPDTVTLIANWIPLEEPAGGPNFYPFADDARYYIKIDNNGDAKADITYRWMFQTQDMRGLDTFLYNNGPVTSLDDENLLFRQTYTLDVIDAEGNVTTLLENAPVAPSRVGDASMPDYEMLRDQAIVEVDDGSMSFAGQADDPFFVDLRVFDLLYGGDLSERGVDTLDGYTVNTIAYQTPISHLTQGKDPVIGVWSTTERPSMRIHQEDGSVQHKGDFVQVSRLGNPLVNEVVIPAGLKDAFNALAPENDASVAPAVDRVLDPEVPKLIEAIYGIPAPKTPRNDLFKVFLTGIEGLNKPMGKVQPAELLRLNTSIPPAEEPNRLGVLAGDLAGFPNGRRLIDDVVDIEIQALEGAVRTGELVEALAAGDRVDMNDVPFEGTFPYVALPHSGSDTGETGTDPDGGVDAGAGGTALDRRSLVMPAEEGNAPWLPMSAAAFGVGFALLGWAVLRRQRGQVR